MSDFKVTGAGEIGRPQAAAKIAAKAGEGFDSVLSDAIGKVAELQSDAEKAISELSSGGDVSQAIIAMEKADLSFQVMVEVRNKLLNAYEEIMRMQV